MGINKQLLSHIVNMGEKIQVSNGVKQCSLKVTTLQMHTHKHTDQGGYQ